MTIETNNIPDELKKTRYWVAWRKTKRENGKIAKIPINPTDGLEASVVNPEHWGTFEDALRAYQKFKLDGIGFVFSSDNPFVGVDIDNCVDENGNITANASKIIELLDSYTEYSPSGLGFHIICLGQLPNGKRRNDKIGIEMYSEKRFFTITGCRTSNSPLQVKARSNELKIVHSKYLESNGDNSRVKEIGLEERDRGSLIGSLLSDWTDEEIIEKAKQGKRGHVFEQLYNGNWSLYYNSQSQAELAFANMLAFWTAKDINMMDRIYRMSELKRAKWDRVLKGSTYGKFVMEKAVNNCTKVYDKKRRKKENIMNIEDIKIQGIRKPEMEDDKTEVKGEKFNYTKCSRVSQEPRIPEISQTPPWYLVSPKGHLKFSPAILAKYLHKIMPVVYPDGRAYKYENGVYLPAKEIELERIVKKYLRDDHATMYAIQDVRKQWMIECSGDPIVFNEVSSTHIINLKNGLYDIYQQKLLPHSPDHHSLIQLDCSYEPNSMCERFSEFINQALPPESVVLAQEIVGYILVLMTQAQKSFILHGPGGTGKSTFIRIIESLVGEQNVSNIAWQDLSDKFRPAGLQGKLLNTFADLPDTAMKDVGMFKSLTGGDRVTSERKNKDPFEFMNTARFLFSANHLPRNFGDNGDSFYRRLIILPFENKIARERMDTRLLEKIVQERNGIFLWALEGLIRLVDNNFMFSENTHTKKVLTKYQRESSSVRWFIEENCEFDTNNRVRKVELYECYRQNCKRDGIQPLDKVKFNNEMEESYSTVVTEVLDGRSRRAFWRGIKLI